MLPACRVSPRIGIDLTATTFDYQTRARIDFWNVRTLLDDGSGGPRSARFLQLEREFQASYRTLASTLLRLAILIAMWFCTLES